MAHDAPRQYGVHAALSVLCRSPSRRRLFPLVIIASFSLLVPTSGCHVFSRKGVPIAELDDGLVIPIEDRDVVWEKTVDVLHAYQFEIARENRLDGVIETHYKVGASLIEPWHRDSIGFRERLESTLQSIRRKVCITITPVDGGQFVTLEVMKELEDVDGIAANSPGAATFHEYQPFRRDLAAVVGQTAPSGWILQGRDTALEQSLLDRLSRELRR